MRSLPGGASAVIALIQGGEAAPSPLEQLRETIEASALEPG